LFGVLSSEDYLDMIVFTFFDIKMIIKYFFNNLRLRLLLQKLSDEDDQ